VEKIIPFKGVKELSWCSEIERRTKGMTSAALAKNQTNI